MGDGRVVTIASPSHFQDLMDGIWNYFVNKYKVDIEITCNGHSLSAHQIVLEIMCPALKMPLTAAAAAVVNRDIGEKEKEQTERKPIDGRAYPVTLNLDHVVSNGEDVALLVEFIYRGKMTVPMDRLDIFHQAARVLGLNSLAAAIEDFRKRGEDAICAKEGEEGNGGGGEDGGGGGGRGLDDDDDDDNDDDCDQETAERGSERGGADHSDVTGSTRNGGGGESGGASSRRKRKRTPVKISQMVCESKEPSSEDDDRRAANGEGPTGTPRPCRLTRSLTQWRLRMETRSSRDRIRKRKEPDMEWTKNSTSRSRLPKSEPSHENIGRESDDGDDHEGRNEVDIGKDVTDAGAAEEEEEEEEEEDVDAFEEAQEVDTVRRTQKQTKTKQTGKHPVFGLQRGGGDDVSSKTPTTPKLHKSKRGARKGAGNGDQKAARSEYSKLWRRNRPPRKCPHCPYETRDKDNYNSHLAKHDPNVERFTCEVCSKKFRNKRGYVCHRRGHLDPELLHRCFHCTFYTPQKASLVQHLAVKHRVDKEGKPLSDNFQCSECDFRCITDTKLKVHVKKKHLVDKPFKCTECDYATFRKGDFDKHVSIRHRHERPYMCEVCGFRSQTQSGYERHKRSHTGEKPYKCDVCGQLYADGRKLKVHLQRHINDEKPFVCHLCGHASRRKDNLQIHLKRIHKTTLDGNGGEVSATDKPHSSSTPDRPVPTIFSSGHRLDTTPHVDARESPCVTTLLTNVPASHYTVKKTGMGTSSQPLSEIVQQQSKQPLTDQQAAEDVSPSEDEAQQVVVQPMVGQLLASDQEQTLTFIVPESAIQHINFFQFPFK